MKANDIMLLVVGLLSTYLILRWAYRNGYGFTEAPIRINTAFTNTFEPKRIDIRPGAIIPCKAGEVEYLTNFTTVFEATWEQRCDPAYRVGDHT